MKKIIVLALSLIMAMSLAVSASADDQPTGQVTLGPYMIGSKLSSTWQPDAFLFIPAEGVTASATIEYYYTVKLDYDTGKGVLEIERTSAPNVLSFSYDGYLSKTSVTAEPDIAAEYGDMGDDVLETYAAATFDINFGCADRYAWTSSQLTWITEPMALGETYINQDGVSGTSAMAIALSNLVEASPENSYIVSTLPTSIKMYSFNVGTENYSDYGGYMMLYVSQFYTAENNPDEYLWVNGSKYIHAATPEEQYLLKHIDGAEDILEYDFYQPDGKYAVVSGTTISYTTPTTPVTPTTEEDDVDEDTSEPTGDDGNNNNLGKINDVGSIIYYPQTPKIDDPELVYSVLEEETITIIVCGGDDIVPPEEPEIPSADYDYDFMLDPERFTFTCVTNADGYTYPIDERPVVAVNTAGQIFYFQDGEYVAGGGFSTSEDYLGVAYITTADLAVTSDVEVYPVQAFQMAISEDNIDGIRLLTNGLGDVPVGSVFQSVTSLGSAAVFTDFESDTWYAENVTATVSADIIKGKDVGVFAPDDEVTLAETVKLAAVIYSQLSGDGYEFVQGDVWYEVYWEYLQQIDGFPALSADDMGIAADRDTFAEIMSFALYLLSEDELSKNDVADGAIPDVTDADYIYALYRAGIVTGSDAEGNFMPESNIKRSEMAALIHRFIDETQRKEVTL